MTVSNIIKKSNFVKVKSAFNSIASVYDENRRKLIPCFDDLYSVPVSLVQNQIGNKKLNVLDLGAGTGLFTAFLLEKYPAAQVGEPLKTPYFLLFRL